MCVLQVSPGEGVEERILALEEAQKRSQRSAEDVLETSELLKNSDLSSQARELPFGLNVEHRSLDPVG